MFYEKELAALKRSGPSLHGPLPLNSLDSVRYNGSIHLFGYDSGDHFGLPEPEHSPMMLIETANGYEWRKVKKDLATELKEVDAPTIYCTGCNIRDFYLETDSGPH